MRFNICRHRRATTRGFTFLEMSIVMIISGLLLVVLMSLFRYRDVALNERMDQQFDRVLFGMAEYFRVFGHYPCPADPTQAVGTANFGVSQMTGGAYSLIPPVGGGACALAQGDLPVRSLNFAVGCMSDGAAEIVTLGEPLDRATLIAGRMQDGMNTTRGQSLQLNSGGTRLDYCLNDKMAVDIYRSKLTYAVSTRSVLVTDPGNLAGTYAFNGGQMILQDQAGNAAAANNAHFVIVSHGQDREGARGRTGNVIVACGTIASPDDENCDGDTTFTISTFADTLDANQFDDRVEFAIFGKKQEMELWDRQILGGNEILRMNPGGGNAPLSIGRVNPTDDTRMAVGGNVWISGALNTTNDISAGSANITIQDPNATTTANDGFLSPKYCYDPPMFPSGGC